jgi:hypothetical protein
MEMQGPKTHEQQRRILENRSDDRNAGAPGMPRQNTPAARQSEFPVSRQGMNQESSHNKHNDPGQSGHKPQDH